MTKSFTLLKSFSCDRLTEFALKRKCNVKKFEYLYNVHMHVCDDQIQNVLSTHFTWMHVQSLSLTHKNKKNTFRNTA